jgi:VWFA-related protein
VRVALVTLTCLLAQAASGASTRPRFEARVESVYVEAFVSRHGEPVRGLTEDSFEVLDKGVAQDARLVNTSEVPIDALLVFDISDSVRGEELDHLREAAAIFLRGLGPDDHARLLSFSHGIRLDAAASHDREALARALSELRPGGATALNDAVYAGLLRPRADAYRRLVLIFSDGDDNSSWLSSSQLLDVARDADALIYSVLVAPRGEANMSSSVLASLAEETGGRALRIESSARLARIFGSIVAELKNRYLLAYEPKGPISPGWHDLKVRLKGTARGSVRARRGYYHSGS